MIKTFLLGVIRAYRYVLSPWIGNGCRYWPTCSEYAMDAVELHGPLRGSWMMLARIARCNPYATGGVDPVPTQFSWHCRRCADSARAFFSTFDRNL